MSKKQLRILGDGDTGEPSGLIVTQSRSINGITRILSQGGSVAIHVFVPPGSFVYPNGDRPARSPLVCYSRTFRSQASVKM